MERPALVSATKKAAQVVAIAASEHSLRNKAYAKLGVAALHKNGEITNSIYTLGIYTVMVGGFGDELEIKWLRECWSKSFE